MSVFFGYRFMSVFFRVLSLTEYGLMSHNSIFLTWPNFSEKSRKFQYEHIMKMLTCILAASNHVPSSGFVRSISKKSCIRKILFCVEFSYRKNMRRPCFYTPTGNQPGHTYAAHSNIHQFRDILPKGRPEIYKYF